VNANKKLTSMTQNKLSFAARKEMRAKTKTSVFKANSRIRNIKFGWRLGVLMTGQRTLTNKIETSKFNLAWLPVSLLKQMKKKVNMYFLLLSILTCFKFSPKDPASMIITFLIVICFSLVKDGLETHQNKRGLEVANLQTTKAYDYGNFKFKSTTFAEIKVGDVVLVERD
jgi:magnesium-transporting ATPase (P-type)